MRNRLSLFTVPYVVWMALLVVAPVIMVVIYAFTSNAGSFTLDNFSDMGAYVSIFSRSFQLAIVATLVCLLIGYPVAYAMAKEGPGFQRIAMVLIMLPMWVNFLLRTYSWMAILENNGLLNQFFSAIGLFDLVNGLFGTDIQYFRMIRTQGAVVLGMVYNYLPFMILPIYTVLLKMDHSLVEAARDLGASTSRVFRKITRLLGGGTHMMLGDLIEQQFLGGAYNPHLGSAIALVMMIIVVVCMYVMNRFGDGEEQAVVL